MKLRADGGGERQDETALLVGCMKGNPTRHAFTGAQRIIHHVRWQRQWQVEPSLISGQVKKSYRRRKLVRVSQVMRLGREAALKRGGKRAAQRDLQRTKALAAGRTTHRWTAREVLSYPLPPVSA